MSDVALQLYSNTITLVYLEVGYNKTSGPPWSYYMYPTLR